MTNYHYTDGVNSFGPFTIYELKDKNIKPDTLIWTEGLSNWTKARDIPEISQEFSFNNVPPTIPSQNETFNTNTDNSFKTNERPPKTYLLETILSTIFCCWPLGIVSIIYAARVERKFYAGDIEGAIQDSANAKKWMVINIIACAILYIGYFGIFGIAAITSALHY